MIRLDVSRLEGKEYGYPNQLSVLQTTFMQHIEMLEYSCSDVFPFGISSDVYLLISNLMFQFLVILLKTK